MTVLSATHIRKQFGDVPLLTDVSFAIEQGSFTMLIGPNGSGKTTLINIILGEIEADAGQISIFGSHDPKERRRIGYVPQRFSFDRSIPLTVKEFLSLITADMSRQRHVLQDVGLLPKHDANVGNLSGGELQRVLIARTLLEEKDMLILDEPTANVDVHGEAQFYTLLQRLRKEKGITILLVTHELALVHKYADTVLCLHQCISCQGDPKTVLGDKHIQAVFGRGMRTHSHH